MKEKILIVEDQFIEANTLKMILEKEGYIVCPIAKSVEAALKLIDEEFPNIVLLDIFLQGPLTGIDLAKILRQKRIPFVYLSANSNKQVLDQAKATHPYGFLVKPFRQKDILVTLDIAKYLHAHSLDAHLQAGEQTNPSTASITTARKVKSTAATDPFEGILGASAALETIKEHIRLVGPTDTSVLILGESGTGKEKIAGSIHACSPRKANPFIKVNCAALPATLIESELFGHEKGSFTGATDRRIGKFEQADGGTIFLDEIGEISFDVQVKLLRVLQEREVERVGGKAPIKLNVRVIAATNRDLEKEIAEGRFRLDLYYRLNAFPINMPPLRERREDIPVLAYHFADTYAAGIGRKVIGFSEEALDKLESYSWPGNIRQLGHVIERSILLNKGDEIKEIILPKEIIQPVVATQEAKTIEQNEREYILEVLKKCGGKIFGKGGAAEVLGMKVSTLNSRIKKLGINKEKYFE